MYVVKIEFTSIFDLVIMGTQTRGFELRRSARTLRAFLMVVRFTVSSSASEFIHSSSERAYIPL